MKADFYATDWEARLPSPVCEQHPEYGDFYRLAWHMAHDHVRTIDGMPQNPYMDEAFCDTQIWIWDSCFMSLFCKYAQDVFPGKETLYNFYGPFYDGRELPAVIPTEKEPDWTGAIPGQPMHIQVQITDNPPLFAWAEYENALLHGDRDYLRALLCDKQYLQKHYEWVEGLTESVKLPCGALPTHLMNKGIGYTWEGGCSGMDNTPRGRTSTPTTVVRPNDPNLLWIDAICQQALAARSLSRMFAILGDEAESTAWQKRYEEKKDIVNRYYWDHTDGFYYDIDCRDRSLRKVPTIGSYWTLTAGIASPEQAKAMADLLFDDAWFGGEVPMTSVARSDPDYVPEGQYWRGSVWLPTAYATLRGLTEYGMHREAHKLADRLLAYMLCTYREYEPHTIWECYAPEGYRPGRQIHNDEDSRPDFCGWSALGPISLYIEYVLGFHTVNAFTRTVEWAYPSELTGEVGIRGLRFGDVETDIVAKDGVCRVTANVPYTLKIDGKTYAIAAGETVITL